MSQLIGKYIGRYHILEQVGQGGMAVVYKAFDTRLEREVAFKIIRTELFGKAFIDRILKRFEREAKALARLDHAHIIKVYDYGDHEGAPYLVMQYVPAGTLKERAKQKLPWQQAVSLLLPIARALAYAHQRGVLHRDVKPSNILITQAGETILTDFGIAKLLEDQEGQTLTGTGVGVGTPEYMAPEQGLGKAVDAKADIYALGVVLFELITGHKPYTADTPLAVLLKQVNDPLPRPKDYVPDLPGEVEKVLFKALAKQLEDRYESMEIFTAALEKLFSLKAEKLVEQDVISDPIPEKIRTPIPTAAQDETRDEFVDITPVDVEINKGNKSKNLKTPPRRKPWLVWGGGLVGLLVLFVLINLMTGKKNSGLAFVPTETATFTQTFTKTQIATITKTFTPQVTSTSTQTLTSTLTATPEYGIGSTLVSEKDGMVMVYVPAGEFEMGSLDGDSDEEQVHLVYLDAYWIDQTEVTNKMFSYFLNEMGNQAEGGVTWLDISRSEVQIVKSDGGWEAKSGKENYPVIDVSWYGAHAYCEWAERELPTEAEWEKAARGIDGEIYPWGNGSPNCLLAQYSECDGDTITVGSLPTGSSPYGVLDMAGNVSEWVVDWFVDDYYSVSSDNNPEITIITGWKTLRGGSMNDNENGIKSGSRFLAWPVLSSRSFGFRCLTSEREAP